MNPRCLILLYALLFHKVNGFSARNANRRLPLSTLDLCGNSIGFLPQSALPLPLAFDEYPAGRGSHAFLPIFSRRSSSIFSDPEKSIFLQPPSILLRRCPLSFLDFESLTPPSSYWTGLQGSTFGVEFPRGSLEQRLFLISFFRPAIVSSPYCSPSPRVMLMRRFASRRFVRRTGSHSLFRNVLDLT